MRFSAVITGLLLASSVTLAQKDPAELPARDSHEGLLVAADPCLDAARAKEKFGKSNPFEAGILAVDVYFRNDTDQAMQIDLSTVRLNISEPGEDRQRITARTPRQVAVLIAHPGGTPNPESPRRRVPEPIPMPSHDKKEDKVFDSLKPLAFDSDVLPPHSTLHGFFFFDLSHDFRLADFATLYIPDVKIVPANKLLTYFEVPLRAGSSH
jgi:hypothetical protein